MIKRSVFGSILATIGLFALQGSALTFAATSGSVDFTVDATQTVLELTVPSNTTTINLAPSVSGASFGAANLNVHVATNNQTGYTLTMTPENTHNDPTKLFRTELIGDEVNYRYIAALAQTSPASTGYPEADFTTNAWGYKITGNNYYGINSTNPTVSSPAWVTDEPTNGDTQSLTLAAKIDADTASGSYATTLVFTATTNAVVAKDTVTFNGNGADNMDAMVNDGFTVVSGTSSVLPSNKYTRANYRFIGWNTAQNGTGVSYANQGEYTAVSDNYSRTITLYAMWSNLPEGSSTEGTTPGGYPGITISRAYEIAYTAAGKGMWEQDEGDIDGDGDTTEYYQVTDGVYHNYDVRWDLQGMTTDICNSVTVLEDSYLAIDVRDFNKYNIVKLKDNRCWLQDNLALNPTDPNTAARMSSTTTNATDAVIYNYLHGGNPSGESGWTSQAVYNAPPGWQFDQFVQPQIDISQVDTVSSDDLDQAGTWKVGVYYNYCAASIGTYCYSRGIYQLDRPGTDIDTIYDICPLGWRMPTSGNEADGHEYQNVELAYYDANHGTGSFNSYRSALHLPLTGEHGYWGNIDYLGESSKFWSATYIYRGNDPNSEMSAATLYKNGWSAGWSSYTNRMLSGSVRCIAK